MAARGRLWLWALIALAALGLGLGVLLASDGEDFRLDAGDYEKPPPASLEEVEERAERCTEVRAAVVRAIEARLEVVEGRITEFEAVRTKDRGLWVVATRIQGSDFDELAVFAARRLAPRQEFFAVDGIAEEFTKWELADGSDGVELQLGDDGTTEALDCID